MNPSRLEHLFERYFDKTASPQERDELATLLQDEENREEIMQLFNKAWESYQGDGEILAVSTSDEMLKQILTTALSQSREGKEAPKIRRIFKWWRVAAAAILVFVVGGYFLLNNNRPGTNHPTIAIVEDINPGTYKAKLKLADGTEIILDSAALGELAKQGNTSVVNKDGQLVYSGNGGDVLYNTVSTAKGETYTMTLADGSMIWLNSASSIYFPVTFPGKERRIEVTGEVYVKVAKNAEKPFIASANGMEVLALGTEFNINAYLDEEHINTTLVEGSVKVSKGSSFTLLQSGQQTQLSSDGKLTAARSVNMDEVTGWKEGWFHFESADLKTILRQFSRWYDVEVVYEGPVTNRRFFGIVKRNSTLKSVLEMLQDNNIRFTIEGKKLIVKSS